MDGDYLPGFAAPVQRALAEPIMMAGAPRALAIVNGTLAAAVGIGLRLWIAGVAVALVGHGLAVFAARRDPQILPVARRHVALPTLFES
ncbi:MAG: VirB3 family type IV secretion system protein [Sphingopyxis sp.]